MELSEKYIKQLENEGFGDVYEHFDNPGYVYPVHSHEHRSTILIVEGSMAVTVNGQTGDYSVGDRIDIPSRAEHEVRVGPAGCKYVIAEG